MRHESFNFPGVAFAIGPPEPKSPTLAFDLLDIGITHAVTQVVIDKMVALADRATALYAGRRPPPHE